MEEPKKCGLCGSDIVNLDHLILIGQRMWCVCQGCVAVACGKSPCYTCGKQASFTFSCKAGVGGSDTSDKRRVTFYFPGCCKDCEEVAMANSEENIKKILGDKVEILRFAHPCKACGGTGEDLSICSGCRLAWYCNDECQKADWKNHKPFCRHPSNKPQPW